MSTARSSCWSITINNPSKDDDECIALAKQKGWKVDGQLEKGKEGTLHYQLMVKTPQVRFAAMKKAFPRAHIEVARNQDALATYVRKEETREGELNISDKYPSLSKYWDLLYNKLSDIFGGPADEEPWDMPDKKKLDLLDQATSVLIEEGYNVETLAVNPQTRSAFAKFSKSILIRVYADRQTDRQCVSVPTINAEDKSINDEGEEAADSVCSDGDGTEDNQASVRSDEEESEDDDEYDGSSQEDSEQDE